MIEVEEESDWHEIRKGSSYPPPPPPENYHVPKKGTISKGTFIIQPPFFRGHIDGFCHLKTALPFSRVHLLTSKLFIWKLLVKRPR